ncbi:hypothetical protein BCU70_13245 [Vibrio sp. 10N.286.49.C2]|uniref:hypothetical protein n=1 Tax=unclassified Vibrio TaxID=2614977 RepID=UPI000C81ED2D|nr:MULTISPECIES: hypothetical protein [unclassified Vibrio]PMH39342.1 hypothetical protein BCU70_13245 [Vibrio sp. 10N.286.49.C2]PMH54308.1 hypothetical protein BCU66_11710 [Vibrio sp. 10N.286.49.B1]PMH79441.1 hypothetical protein BCU58_05240 [Vibrio sp. 10N.286.48.B7]
MTSVNKQLKLFGIAGVIAILNIGAHLLGAKMFIDLPMAEITMALIPVVMIVLCIVGFKMADKE